MRVLQTGSRTKSSAATWPDSIQPASIAPPTTSGMTRPRLPASEWRRRMLHILPGFLPFLLWVIPHTDPWGPILIGVLWGLTLLIGCNALLRFGFFARTAEDNGQASVLGYTLPVLGTMCLCRGYEEVGVMTLAVLAFGDGSATLGGLLIGGWRLPWNREKTAAGLLSFWMVGGFFATVMYWGEARPVVTWATAVAIAGPTVLLAGLVETLPFRRNDNFQVGVISAVTGVVLHHWVVG